MIMVSIVYEHYIVRQDLIKIKRFTSAKYRLYHVYGMKIRLWFVETKSSFVFLIPSQKSDKCCSSVTSNMDLPKYHSCCYMVRNNANCLC